MSHLGDAHAPTQGDLMGRAAIRATAPGASVFVDRHAAAAGLGEINAQTRMDRNHAKLAAIDTVRLRLHDARAKMRATLIGTIEDLVQTKFTRLIEGSDALVKRLTARIRDDMAGAGYDQKNARKQPDGRYVIQTNFAWAKRVMTEELTELAELDHKEFVGLFERFVTADDASLGPMRKALAVFVEEAPMEIDENNTPGVEILFQAERLATHLLHEPRATLLEWGALLAGADDADLAIAAKVLSDRAETTLPVADMGASPYQNAANIMVDVARAWAQCGFPMLAPSHKLAASLMATDTPSEAMPELVLPWPTFALLVPSGLLPIKDRTIKLMGMIPCDQAFRLMDGRLRALGPQPVVWMATERHTMLYAFALPNGLSDLADLSKESARSIPNLDERELASFRLLGRLMLGTLIELDQEKHHTTIRRGPPARTASKPKKGQPKTPKQASRVGPPGTAWAFALTRDVKVDLRHWVRDYVAGGGTKASVCVLRRGHHRHQAHGPQRSLRKWIHIEPHWINRGASVVAVRTHRMDERSDAGKDI